MLLNPKSITKLNLLNIKGKITVKQESPKSSTRGILVRQKVQTKIKDDPNPNIFLDD